MDPDIGGLGVIFLCVRVFLFLLIVTTVLVGLLLLVLLLVFGVRWRMEMGRGKAGLLGYEEFEAGGRPLGGSGKGK